MINHDFDSIMHNSKHGLNMLILLLPVTASLGAYIMPVKVGYFHLFGFRLLCIFLAVISIAKLDKKWWNNIILRRYVLLGYLWMCWGLAGLFWTPSVHAGIIELAAIVFGFGLVIALCNLDCYGREGVELIRKGWVMAYIGTGLIAIWELATHKHLSGSYYVQRAAGYILDRSRIAISTFGNPNDYGAFIVLCLPFLLWSYESKESRLARAAYVSLIVSSIALVLYTSSRLALIGILFQLGLYVFVVRPKLLWCVVTLILIAIMSIGVYYKHPTTTLPIMHKFRAIALGDTSVQTRINLTKNGMWLTYCSRGIGVGPAGFAELVKSKDLPFSTGYIANPHNFWVEVLAQYGVLVFSAVVSFLSRIVVIAIKTMRMDRRVIRSGYLDCVSVAVLIGVAGYVFAAAASSSYVKESVNWMWLNSMAMMGGFLHRETTLSRVEYRST